MVFLKGKDIVIVDQVDVGGPTPSTNEGDGNGRALCSAYLDVAMVSRPSIHNQRRFRCGVTKLSHKRLRLDYVESTAATGLGIHHKRWLIMSGISHLVRAEVRLREMIFKRPYIMVWGQRQRIGFRSVLGPQDRGRYRRLRSHRREVEDNGSKHSVSIRAYCGYALESSSPR